MTKRLPAWLDWRIPAALAVALALTAVGLFLVHNDHRSVTHITRITIRPTPHVVTAPPRVRLIPPVRAHRPPQAPPHRAAAPHGTATHRSAPRRPHPAPTTAPTCLPLPVGVCVHAH